MKHAGLIAALVSVSVAVPAPLAAQANDNDQTTLGSRINRGRQFPTEPVNTFAQRDLGSIERERSRSMESQFSKCLYARSNEDALDLLRRTDYGFADFEQIGIDNGRVSKIYPIQTCLYRVASTHDTGVSLRATPASMRRWMLQAAYLKQFPTGPSWFTSGGVVAERQYPLSAANVPMRQVIELADCVTATEPYAADFFFRSSPGSAEEREALQPLVGAVQTCLPEGQEAKLDPALFREWIGEALWHASQNTSAPSAERAQEKH